MNKSDYNDASSAKRMCDAGIEDLNSIINALPQEGSLPTWWTNKLAVSTAYLNSLRDYLVYNADSIEEEEDDDDDDVSDLYVGSYKTKHFDLCPQAASLYKQLQNSLPEDKISVATQAAMLHDMLFYLEKQIIKEQSASNSEVEVAEDLVNNILLLADSMGNRSQHSYLKDVHLAKIKEYNKANVPDEDMLPPSYKQVGI